MLDKVVKKMDCSFPWSKNVSNGLKVCGNQEDFETYFTTLKEYQDDFRKAPKKCKYRTWNLRDRLKVDKDGSKGLQLIMEMENDQVQFLENEVMYLCNNTTI